MTIFPRKPILRGYPFNWKDYFGLLDGWWQPKRP